MESEIQLKKYGIPLMIGIWNPIITKKESGIQGVESRIPDCLGLPYMPYINKAFGFNIYKPGSLW